MADQHFYFDIWPANDPSGTALGELTDAFDKKTRDVDQAIGEGQFSINRHSSQAAWCVSRAMVRVRLATGGPFAYNDARYVFGFFIETSNDVALSSDEEGGEILTRGGRATPSWLHTTIIYPNANISGHRQYWTQAKTVGDVIFKNKTVGEAFRILILNSMDRAGVLDGLTIDFTINDDSSSTPWPETDTDWRFPVGMNLLDVLSKLVSSQTYFRMTPGLLLSCYEDHPGADLSGSITFTKGVDLAEAANKEINAQGFMSRALVKGQKADNQLTFLQVFNTTIEASTGRYEGFVEYQATPTTARLTKAGNQAISRSKLQHDGPTTAGVYSTTAKPYDDYLPGDTVGLDIPGVYDTDDVKVAAIILSETEGGEYDVGIEFTDSPFDPMSGPDNFSSVDDRTTGGPGSGGKGCGDCPESTPFVPPTDATDLIDAVLEVGSAAYVVGATVDREQHYASQVGKTSPTLVVGRQYRLVVDVIFNGVPGSPFTPDDIQSGLGAAIVNPDQSLGIITQGGIAGLDWTPDNGTNTAALTYGANGLSYNIVSAGGYATGSHIEGEWLTLTADGGPDVTADVMLAGEALSGFWGFHNISRVRLQHRNGDTTPIEGESATAPRQGQVVPETATDPPVADVYTTNYPYVAGSLRVWVGGILVGVTEVDNTAGTWSFLDGFDPGTSTIVVQYQALNDDATGATNAPWAPGNPPSLIDSGAETLDDLTDVVITAPADGDVLTYDTGSGDWVNAVPTGGVAGHYEVVLDSGAGPFLLPDGDPQPPYPVTNEAEDDWLYAFVAD